MLDSLRFQNRIPSNDDLKKWVVLSLSFHVVVFLTFIVRITFFPSSEPIQFQSSVRVDLVALPDKAVTPSPATLPKPEVKTPIKETKVTEKIPPVDVKQPDTVDLKKKQKTAIERLKALQQLEDEAKAEKPQQKKAAPIKGNVLAAGSSIKGLNKLEYDTYIGDLDNHIKSNWVLPEWMTTAGLRARVLVKIDDNGVVKEKHLILSSNNAEYDAAVMDAVTRSSPFPVPPEKFVNIVGVDGIIFQFPD